MKSINYLSATTTASAVIVSVATATENDNKNDYPKTAVVAVSHKVTHKLSSFRLHYILLQIINYVTKTQEDFFRSVLQVYLKIGEFLAGFNWGSE